MNEYSKQIQELFLTVFNEGASDLHLSAGRQPTIRVSGQLIPLSSKKTLSSEDTLGLLSTMLDVAAKERFLQDSYSTMKREIAETLLTRYGTINEYAFLKNNLSAVSRPIVAEMIQNRMKEFVPQKPANSVTVLTMLDTLISYTKQCESQNWLADANFVKELSKKLDNAKKHLTKPKVGREDSVKCYKEVREFQKKVNEVYKETMEKEKEHEKKEKKFITIEGWKFLYYNAQYIMDRLPHKKNEKDDDERED